MSYHRVNSLIYTGEAKVEAKLLPLQQSRSPGPEKREAGSKAEHLGSGQHSGLWLKPGEVASIQVSGFPYSRNSAKQREAAQATCF